MNIFILGNGFDLAHYLPTAYNDFMYVMRSIIDTQKNEMTFDDLFEEENSNIIEGTKKLYKTEEVKLDKEKLESFKKISENCWFNYFNSKTTQNINTWIDFESEIKFALSSLCEFIQIVNTLNEPINISYLDRCRDIKYASIYKELLLDLKIIEQLKYKKLENSYENSEYTFVGTTQKEFKLSNINYQINYGGSNLLRLNAQEIFNDLLKGLRGFNKFFYSYIEDIIDQLTLNVKENINLLGNNLAIYDNNIFYSFNYSKTVENLYKEYLNGFNPSYDIYHIHGPSLELDNTNNIVLGIDNVDDNLKPFNIFGFTKEHQKMMFNTDRFFYSPSDISSDNIIRKALTGESRIIVFGHSLDISDRIYIERIFKLLNIYENSQNVRLKLMILYHNEDSKCSLLNNLIKIMGDQVYKFYEKDMIIFEKLQSINVS